MVIAADSRDTLTDGRYCDGVEKIFVLQKHTRAVIAMHGSYAVTTGKNSGTDACAFIRDAQSSIDFRLIARDFLNSRKGLITIETIRALESDLKLRVDALLPTNPQLIQPDGGIVGFSFAQYLPTQKTVIYAAFKLAPTDARHAGIQAEVLNKIHLSDRVIQVAYLTGNSQCFTAANSPEGRRSIGATFLQEADEITRKNPTVGELDSSDGLSFARDIVNSTIRYSDLHPTMNCQVGGPLKGYRLDSHPKPVELKQ